ncbi:hypothetical protein HMPREF9123_2236 [Neisseria bacilliformis ATCC BAA-1200]|uniref:Uncharacterized protein n=1 Tax=Neisseria bacilliformis ATCC BAA-1200 TaxID=888742 RepID=F2BES9_9NEIS|nr:hypothetical protein HMPREF9123_2236 [Neisseria bacilliformis ATCC BAA-1200]
MSGFSGCLGCRLKNLKGSLKKGNWFSGCLEPRAQQSCTPYAMRATLACV